MNSCTIALWSTILSLTFTQFSSAQTQSIRGQVKDLQTGQPIPYANILVMQGDSVVGTVSDLSGYFEVIDLQPGRYEVKSSYIGYQENIIADVILQAHQPAWLEFSLEEVAFNLSEITVKPEINKKATRNEMIAVSGRLLSVEEANRYAGGFDDPARLASAFAGVSSNIQTNGISIRGNAPKYLQWKMEGVEIPNPNHFADLSVVGGGGLTALSSQVMDNADFLTGAMPAVFDNALSGVFDLSLRKGSSEDYRHQIQIGIIGLDFASEGPIKKKKNSSYLVNYRYSTLGLVQPLLPDEAGKINYQDLSFKLTFPSLKRGTIEWWGLGLFDVSQQTPLASGQPKYLQDLQDQKVDQYMGATGLKYQKYFNNKFDQIFRTQLALTTNNTDLFTRELTDDQILYDKNRIFNGQWNGQLLFELNSRFKKQHSNYTGFRMQSLHYDLLLREADRPGTLTDIIRGKGSSHSYNFYSNSAIHISPKSKFIAGINSRYFSLNKEWVLEPRISFSHQVSESVKISAGYGLHSRLEPLAYYFVKDINDNFINRALKSSKAHHLVGSIQFTPAENYLLKIEPYYQFLFHIPVTEDQRLSFMNLTNDWFLRDKLINTGEGQNIGVDITCEKYISRGFYGLATLSFFDARFRYQSGQKWLNTRYNSRLIANLLFGKEFYFGTGGNKKIGLNYRITHQGGLPYTPVQELESLSQGEIIFDHSQPFSSRFPAAWVHHVTLNYAVVRPRTSHEVALKILNAAGYKEFESFRINLISNQVEEYREALVIPNFSYKISF